MTKPNCNLRRQRGITLIGLLTWTILLGFIGYLLVRVIPTISEAYTVQGVVDRLAAAPPPTVAEIRRAFDRQKQIDATIVSVAGKTQQYRPAEQADQRDATLAPQFAGWVGHDVRGCLRQISRRCRCAADCRNSSTP